MNEHSPQNPIQQLNALLKNNLDVPHTSAGKLYYRADTRPPEQIFANGFFPRTPEYADNWWKEAIKCRGYSDDCGINYQAIDADPSVCVCITTKLESAPIFPLNNEDCYIYALALPEPTKVEYLEKGDGRVKLSRTTQTPLDPKEIIIDLHDLQSIQASNSCRFFKHQLKNISAYAGWALYAYEALAYKIPPQSIICAVQCKRQKKEPPIQIDCPLGKHPKTSEDKKFVVTSNIIENNHFCQAHHFFTGKSGAFTLSVIDYRPLKEQAVSVLNKLKERKENTTPNIYYGLGGKTF